MIQLLVGLNSGSILPGFKLALFPKAQTKRAAHPQTSGLAKPLYVNIVTHAPSIPKLFEDIRQLQ